MILRRLLFLALVVGLGWLLQRIFNALGAARRSRQQDYATGGRTVASAAPTRMVRDRVCNTFLPESRALRSELDGEEHFFCSERCRRQFLDRPIAS